MQSASSTKLRGLASNGSARASSYSPSAATFRSSASCFPSSIMPFASASSAKEASGSTWPDVSRKMSVTMAKWSEPGSFFACQIGKR